MDGVIKSVARASLPGPIRHGLRMAYTRAEHFGLRYACPICRSRLKVFRAGGSPVAVLQQLQVAGGGYRQHAFCPVCGATDRERLLYLLLVHQTDLFTRPQRLLHIAPERIFSKMLRSARGIDYLTGDLYQADVDVKMDITSIGFADGTFDAIICNHVLEHIADDRQAIAELRRVLKPGGWAILQVPISLTLEKTYEDFAINTEADRERCFGQSDHVRIYAMDYKDRLREVGLDVRVFDWTTDLRFGGAVNRFGLNEKEPAYFASRP
jgi:SAM-dependent methyltransferase